MPLLALHVITELARDLALMDADHRAALKPLFSRLLDDPSNARPLALAFDTMLTIDRDDDPHFDRRPRFDGDSCLGDL